MFSQRLKELRKLRGLSQAALSQLLGVSQQAVGKWETGRSTPDPQTVAAIAAELGGSAALVATGGLAGRIIPYCRHDIEIDDYMLLRGLSLIWERNRREKRREARQTPRA